MFTSAASARHQTILAEAALFAYHYICSIRVNTGRLSKTSESTERVHRVQGLDTFRVRLTALEIQNGTVTQWSPVAVQLKLNLTHIFQSVLTDTHHHNDSLWSTKTKTVNFSVSNFMGQVLARHLPKGSEHQQNIMATLLTSKMFLLN